jgi:eukaryotic-like serine/threonine-protein kinase
VDRGADPLVGRLLDDRYSLVRRVARGGTATVYEARDLRLERVCAVKVMHPDLGDPDEFRARFVREAHAAARLSSPNVVAVTDQGDDRGVLFLVMEYVPGRTLRDVIREEAPLPPARALALLDPVLAALAEAHRCGLVHRDVKPENVLISDDGRVKVTDFGLARAFDATATQAATGGILVGTVSYLAPELIENQRADPRADVYAAGVVLHELLTGRKPHQGEGPIQIAYKHVHEDVPAPSLSAPAPLPAYVDALVLRSTARDRDRRQADAKVFLHQVRRVRAALEAGDLEDPELTTDLLPTLVVAPPESIDYVDEAPTVAVHAWARDHGVTDAAEDTGVLTPQAPGPQRLSRTPDQVLVGAPTGPTGPVPSASALGPTLPPRPPAPPPQRIQPTPSGATPARPRKRRSRRGPVVFALVVVLTVLVAWAGWWLGVGRYTSTPGIINLSVADARSKLETAGLDLQVADQVFSETVPAGSVIDTDPEAGARIVDGSTVEVVVSKGLERYTVPKLHGRTVAAAEAALTDASLTLGDVAEQWHDTVPEGRVVIASPSAGQEERRDTPVDLVVSKGPKPVKIPDLAGKDADGAQARLTDLGLEVRVTEENSKTVDEGVVISQRPNAGIRHRGDKVDLVVSLGPVMVEVPDLSAMSVDEATDALRTAGLQVEVRETQLFVGLDRVVGQDADPGDSLPEGSVVTISIV